LGYVFPEEVIQEVRSASDIHEIVSEYVPLKKSGSSFRGLCPFHSEKTPSFFVNPDKQIFHCFGCGKGGNVFTFMMLYENIPFPEAVRALARRRGIRLPSLERRDDREESLRKNILSSNQAALEFYRKRLKTGADGKRAMEYLVSRGIDADGADRFQLGWSQDEWEALKDHLLQKGFSEEVLHKAGLIIPRKGERGYYDRFRNRLIFPIHNERGEVVAFGGRSLDESIEPKYMNSPETPVYQKSRVLYGLNLAKGKIREAGFAAVVEGYTDLTAAHMAGVTNAVATLGTALTRHHLRLLKRYTSKVVVIYDADSAGNEAAKRSLEIFLEEDLAGYRAALPDGHDPDSLIRRKGAEAFTGALKNSHGLMEFYMEQTAAEWRGEGIEGKARAVAELMPLLAKISNHIKRSEYTRSIAQLLDVREEALAAELRTFLSGRGADLHRAAAAVKNRGRCSGEEELVRAMLMDGKLALRIKDEFPLPDFSDESCRMVATEVYGLMDRGESVDPGMQLNLADPKAAALAARLLAEVELASDLERKVDDCLLSFRQARLSRELKDIQEKIRKAEAADDNETINHLLKIKHKIRQNMMA
jgi:DNA primase